VGGASAGEQPVLVLVPVVLVLVAVLLVPLPVVMNSAPRVLIAERVPTS